MYSVIDRANKKLFTYNAEGYLNYVIGFEGVFEGNFIFPTAIKYVGDQIIVSDSTEQRTIITLFEPTEFGALVNLANALAYEGESIDAADVWNEVLNLNANYTLGHIGIGYAYYRQEEYELAMQAFELGQDRENYSRAYEELRKQNFEENFPIIGAITILVIVLTMVFPVLKDIFKKEK
jgi:tetratricopeptide (TPR) repeat protein